MLGSTTDILRCAADRPGGCAIVYSMRPVEAVKSELETSLKELPLLKLGIVHALSLELSIDGEAAGRVLDDANGAAASAHGADLVLLVRAVPPTALVTTPHRLIVTAVSAMARGAITPADLVAAAAQSNDAVAYLRALAVAGPGAPADVQGTLEALHSASVDDVDVHVRKIKKTAAQF